MSACACNGSHLRPHFYLCRPCRIPRFPHRILRRPHRIPRNLYSIFRNLHRILRNLCRDGRKVHSAARYSHFGLCRNCIAARNSRFAPRNDSRCHLRHDWRARRRGACPLCPDGDGGESSGGSHAWRVGAHGWRIDGGGMAKCSPRLVKNRQNVMWFAWKILLL